MSLESQIVPLLQVVVDCHGPSREFAREAKEMVELGFAEGLFATLRDWKEEVAYPSKIEGDVLGAIQHMVNPDLQEYALELASKAVREMTWNKKEVDRARKERARL